MRHKIWQALELILAIVIGVPLAILAVVFFIGPYVLLLWRILFPA